MSRPPGPPNPGSSAPGPPTTQDPAQDTQAQPDWPGWADPTLDRAFDHDPVQPTGPVDHVPVPPPLRPGASSAATRAGVVRRKAPGAVIVPLALGLLALLLLELGLPLRFGGIDRTWGLVPTWSAFATVAVLTLAVPLLPPAMRPSGRTAWQIAAGGVAGLGVFWVLVVLPLVSSDRGFVLTAALALAAGALWLSPGRGR